MPWKLISCTVTAWPDGDFLSSFPCRALLVWNLDRLEMNSKIWRVRVITLTGESLICLRLCTVCFSWIFLLLILTVTSRVGYFPISQRKEKLAEIMLLARVLIKHDGVQHSSSSAYVLYLFNTVRIFKCIFSLEFFRSYGYYEILSS